MSQASAAAISTYPDPHKITSLRTEALRIIRSIRDLQEEQHDIISRTLHDLPGPRLRSDVRRQIADLEEQLDLLLSEYERRRI